MDGGGKGSSSISVFNKFVDLSIIIHPQHLSLIIPSRWFTGGKGLDEFRDKMLIDNRINKIVDFFDSTTVFPTADISGGICYFLWTTKKHNLCEIISYVNGEITSMKRPLMEENSPLFIRFNKSVSILRKIFSQKEKSFNSLVSTRRPFGDINIDNSTKEDKIFVYAYPKNGYISSKSISFGEEYIKQWKVFITKAYGERGEFPYFVIGKPFIGKPNEVCTETYLLIQGNNSENICKNIISYMKSKFFRFLVLQIKNTQNAPKGVYRFVPIQDFSETWTDEKLYKKYDLTKEEIATIEQMIKPME